MPSKDREKRLAYWREYRVEHKEKIRLYQADYWKKHEGVSVEKVKHYERNEDFSPVYYTDKGCKKADECLGVKSHCLSCAFPLGFSEDCS